MGNKAMEKIIILIRFDLNISKLLYLLFD